MGAILYSDGVAFADIIRDRVTDSNILGHLHVDPDPDAVIYAHSVAIADSVRHQY